MNAKKKIHIFNAYYLGQFKTDSIKNVLISILGLELLLDKGLFGVSGFREMSSSTSINPNYLIFLWRLYVVGQKRLNQMRL